jgi:hypothetical protein
MPALFTQYQDHQPAVYFPSMAAITSGSFEDTSQCLYITVSEFSGKLAEQS